MLRRMKNEGYDVVVVGSCFLDLLCYVPNIPKPGETVKGTKFQKDFGGKAANQCVMASKLGARTAMVAKLGNDQFGKDTVENFKKHGVNTEHVSFTDDTYSGVTSISVDSNGQPAFVSLVGANKQLTEDDVKRATEVMKSSSVLICDKGIPIEVGAAALKLGNNLGLTTIFNPAPKVKSIPPSMYPTIDVMVINADEGYSMTGFPVDCVESAKVVLSEFHKRGSPKVVLTLGKDGAVCSEKGSAEDATITHVPAQKVNTVDTTGAGDALIGALAFFMACQPDLSFADMVNRAVQIASVTVTKHGVQASYPTRDELPQDLFTTEPP